MMTMCETHVHIHIPGLDGIEARLAALEAIVATEVEALNALTTKVDDLVADVRAALEQLRAEVGNLSPEGQAALDALEAKVDAFDAEVGDADGSDTPPGPEPTPAP